MKKQDLINAIANDAELSYAAATRAFNAFNDAAVKELQAGGEVPLGTLGKLIPKERAARTGRNPQTGEALNIPAARTAAFKAGKALKDALN